MILRKIGAAVAVSALVLAAVVGGSTAAYAAPTPPTVDQTFADPWITDQAQPIFHGNMDFGMSQIDVETSPDGVNYTPYCSTVPGPSATVWACSSPTGTLPLGLNYVRAIATDTLPEASAPGPAITITVVNSPTITSPADDVYTNDYEPTFAGTADGSYFDVYSTDFATHFCGGTVVNSAWNCTPLSSVPDGDYSYLVQTTFGATTIYSASRTIHIDTTAPAAPTINPFANPVNSTPGPNVSGAAEENASIEVFVDGISVPCPVGTIDYTGYWSCTIGTTLSSGSYTVMAFQTDIAGNLSPISANQPLTIKDNTPPLPPVVTSPFGFLAGGASVVFTNSTGATVTGTGEPGATLRMFGNNCMIWPTIVDSGGNWTCQLTTPMSPDNDYDVFFGLTDPALNSSPLASPFMRFSVDTVPPPAPDVLTPTGPVVGGIIIATTTNPHPVITGVPDVGATIQIVRDGSIPVPCVGGAPIMTEGEFTCTVASTLSPGVYNFAFAQTDLAGNSSGLPVTKLQLTVTAPPAPPAPVLPPAAPVTPPVTPPVQPPVQPPTIGLNWLLSFAADNNSPAAGQNVTLTGANLPRGATVTAELHSTPISLGTSRVGDDGTFTLNTVIPNTAIPGDHHYVVTVTPVDGLAKTAEIPVVVTAMPTPIIAVQPAPTSSTDTNSSGSGLASTGLASTGEVDRDAPDAPNQLSHALPKIQDILANPLIVVGAAVSSLALLFLVAFPAEILNSTLDENYERIFGKLPKVRLPWLARLRDRLQRTPLVGGLALTTLAALILSFADPHFGFDLASLRLFLACAIGMLVLGYVANAITGLIIRRRWNITSAIELQPFGLFIALVGVVLSRVLDFAPGLLIGLVLGLSLSATASKKEETRAALVWVGVVLGLSVAGWLAYSLLPGAVAPGTFAGALFDDSVVAIATEGISGLVIGLLPIGFLDGRSIFQHSKVQWLATYSAALLAFFVIVVPSGALWGGIDGPFWVWLIILVAFAAACFATYLWFRAHPEPEEVLPQSVESVESASASVTGN